jgi:threonyl-tRNA synthetase
VENAERYDISYTDQDGEKKRPVILHCSPSGAIERCIYALLEKEFMEGERGMVPMLPVWLSPTQVRIISLGDRHLERCREIAKRLGEFRVDIDDREETVNKKVRDAAKEWVPYVVTIGDAEMGKDKLPVVVRSESSPGKPARVEMTVEELIKRLRDDVNAMPARPLPLAESLAKRPKFVGSI